MKNFASVLALAAGTAYATDLKMASVADIHLFTDYDPNASDANDGYCWDYAERASEVAYFGRWNCDIPEVTVRAILQNLQDQQPDLDVLFMPGDIVAHAVSFDHTNTHLGTSYEELLEITKMVADMMIEYFPNAVLIPTLGNNDTKWHYQPPYEDEDGEGGSDFLEYYWTWFFENHPTNSQLTDLASIKTTFMEGGYFSVQLSDTLTVISTDTLYFDNENLNPDRQMRVNQLAWFRDLLANSADDMTFILTDHIYETGAFNGADVDTNHGFSANWYEDADLFEFYRELWLYKDKIAFHITAHDHLTDLRVHSSKELYSQASDCMVQLPFAEDPFLGKMISPSFTAQQWQNPGYATFEWSDETSTLINPAFAFLQLNQTIGQPENFTDFEWFYADLGELFDLNELSSQSIHDFADRMEADFDLAKQWLTVRRGYAEYGELNLEGDVNSWGFAPAGTTQDEIFTSLDTGLLPVFCLMRHSMYTTESTSCYENRLQTPHCT